jgi:hypothetical protein
MSILDSVRMQIKKMGVDEFIRHVSDSDFPKETAAEYEEAKVFINGYPSLSTIYYLAK